MDELFADSVLKALFKNKHAPWTLATVNGVSGTSRLINSRKFSINQDVAVAGSSVALDALIKNRFHKLTELCKAPYPCMWLEYHVKHSGSDWSADIGVLIDAAPRSLAIELVVQRHNKDQRPTVLPVIFVVNTDMERPIKLEDLQGYKTIIVNEALDKNDKIASHLLSHVYLRYHGKKDIEDDVCSMASRMIIAVLGILSLVNVVPTEIKQHQRKAGHRLLGGRLRPYFDSSTVTISLPAKKITKFYGAALKDPKFRMRRHEVRGHWRHYLNADGTLKKRRWVESYDRGDASLGWVRHSTYSVEGTAGVTLPKVAYQTPTED